MPTSYQRWLFPVLLVGGLLAFIVWIGIKTGSGTGSVTISLAGYTNLPNNPLRFALFTISNQTGHSVRWRNDWSEAEGSPNHWARITNRQLPGFDGFKPVLKPGDSFIFAVGEPQVVGEPYDSNTNAHWRFSMAYVPDSIKERMVDYELHHHVALKIGPFSLVDEQKVLNSSNEITSSVWLVK